MILYHGSNIEIKEPKIIKSKRLLDFGTGFYLTSDYEQAEKWAIRTVNRFEIGAPIISVFDLDEEKWDKLNKLTFESANAEWLKYVSLNRTDKAANDNYDVVIGPVANDQAFRTVNNYLKGYFSEEIAIQLLLPQRLKDQYTFKTEQALAALNLREAKCV
ncbi:MAG: DUF3990 domain-containing protein [Oscillospiraceae bacterium]|nr:DUF3990 domain-containing protein [Oscillospiraceae bacterium]